MAVCALDFVTIRWAGDFKATYLPTWGLHQIQRRFSIRPMWEATWAGCAKPVRSYTYNGACRKAHRRLTDAQRPPI